MLFRAIVVNKETLEHKQTAIQLDPWEKEIGERNNVIPFRGPMPVGEWIPGSWPTFAYHEPTMEIVGKEGEYTLFRRAVDRERAERWGKGERFQVDSYVEELN